MGSYRTQDAAGIALMLALLCLLLMRWPTWPDGGEPRESTCPGRDRRRCRPGPRLLRQDGWDAHYDARFTGGRVTAIMGASGSGKSTLLDLVAGFRVPASGSVTIGGREVTTLPPRRVPCR